MSEDQLPVPPDFKPLRGNFPVALEKSLGYFGSARWVAFWWDDDEDDVACADGAGPQQTTGQWEYWTTAIAPLCGWLRANWRVHLGATEEPATHWLVWDRLQQAAYVAPVESAEQFLQQQKT